MNRPCFLRRAGALLAGLAGCSLSAVADGLVHVTYTWKRQRIKHVVLDPARLVPRDFIDGEWPR